MRGRRICCPPAQLQRMLGGAARVKAEQAVREVLGTARWEDTALCPRVGMARWEARAWPRLGILV